METSKVLLLEDDYVINMYICGLLEDLGLVVSRVHTADAAIDLINGGEYLKALVTDIDLGVGLNGFDVARHARKAYPNLPVVFVSGAMASRHAAEGVAGSVLVAKPFHPRRIREALDQVVSPEPAHAAVLAAGDPRLRLRRVVPGNIVPFENESAEIEIEPILSKGGKGATGCAEALRRDAWGMNSTPRSGSILGRPPGISSPFPWTSQKA